MGKNKRFLVFDPMKNLQLKSRIGENSFKEIMFWSHSICFLFNDFHYIELSLFAQLARCPMLFLVEWKTSLTII